jgi:hypothetical protein
MSSFIIITGVFINLAHVSSFKVNEKYYKGGCNVNVSGYFEWVEDQGCKQLIQALEEKEQ